jgi:hypothetical protein
MPLQDLAQFSMGHQHFRSAACFGRNAGHMQNATKSKGTVTMRQSAC